MPKPPHWFDPYYAAGFFGDLLDAAIEVTKTSPKKDPPKPPPPRDKGQKKEPAS